MNLVTFSPIAITRPAQSEHGMPLERTGQGVRVVDDVGVAVVERDDVHSDKE
jgi:hypothetical protein